MQNGQDRIVAWGRMRILAFNLDEYTVEADAQSFLCVPLRLRRNFACKLLILLQVKKVRSRDLPVAGALGCVA